MRLLGLIACAWALGAAAPSPTTPPVPSSSNPKGAPQTAPAPANPEKRGPDGLSAYERESLAVDRAANRIGQRANSIADAERVYGLLQLVLGVFGVGFTGVAAFFAWRATHWAKEAAGHTKRSADADNAALDEMRASATEARKDAAAQSKRLTEQLRLADQTMQYTAETSIAMRDSARETRAVAKAMRESGEAITRQANIAEDTAEKHLRAYVHAESARIFWAQEGYPLFRIVLRNTGQTPAMNVRVGAFSDRGPMTHVPSAKSAIGLAPELVIGAGVPHDTVLIVQGSRQVEAASITDANLLYVLGRVEYDDVFGSSYITEFAFFTVDPKPSEGALSVMGGRRASFTKIRKPALDNKKGE